MDLIDRAPSLFDRLVSSDRLAWERIYSHFATSDEADKAYALRQQCRFDTLLSLLDEKRLRPPMVHMANSGAILDLPTSRYTAVRPGLLLYSYYPSKDISRSIPLRQVMAFRTQVANLQRKTFKGGGNSLKRIICNYENQRQMVFASAK